MATAPDAWWKAIRIGIWRASPVKLNEAMTDRKVCVMTFLAPNMRPVYEFVVAYVSQKLDYAMELVVGSNYDELAGADFCFLCV